MSKVERPVTPPLSGQIIGVIATALKPRGAGLHSRTAQRYFRGQAISEESRRKIFEALVQALMELGVTPTSHFIGDKGEITFHKSLADGIAEYANKIDELRALAQLHSNWGMTRADATILLLRVAVFDLALRLSAALCLYDIDSLGERVPAWACSPGNRKYLKGVLGRCDKGKLTRDKLTEALKVDDTTVDSWLDSDSRPSDAHVSGLAKVLGEFISGITKNELLYEMRRHYALAALGDSLAKYIERDLVVDLASSLNLFATCLADRIRTNMSPPSVGTLFHGIWWHGTPSLISYLWEQEVSQEWKAVIAAVSSWYGLKEPEWSIPLLAVAQRVDRDASPFLIKNRLENGSPSPPDIRWLERSYVNSLVVQTRAIAAKRPDSAQAHYDLGLALLLEYRLSWDISSGKEALSEFMVAVQLKPDWEVPQIEINFVRAELGDFSGSTTNQ